jgi:hypothetical protein
MSRLCQYDYTETPGVLICIKCQRTKETGRVPADAVGRKCTVIEASLPVTTLATNFVKAQVAHFRNGRPKCTQEQINERLAICKDCPFFKGNKCTKCGCNCNNNPNSWKNKLAMADAACPLNPPKWREIPPSGV